MENYDCSKREFGQAHEYCRGVNLPDKAASPSKREHQRAAQPTKECEFRMWSKDHIEGDHTCHQSCSYILISDAFKLKQHLARTCPINSRQSSMEPSLGKNCQ